jgi:hypothetical protein
MRQRTRSSSYAIVAFLLACAALSSASSIAAEPDAAPAEPAKPDAWKFQAVIYGYLPSVDGTTSFSGTGGGGSDVGTDAGSILDSLQFAFMGAFDARHDKWGVFADVVYADFGKSVSNTRDLSINGTPIPGDVSASVDFNLTGWCWTVVGTYTAFDRPHFFMEAVAGVRILDLKENLAWNLSGNIGSVPVDARQGDRGSNPINWDGVVGVRGRVPLGAKRRWFIPYYLDLGSGESTFTWQAVAGVGYSWKWGDVLAAWRYLDYDMKSGSDIETLSFSGPAIGVAFRW